jgi:hypothetical protein
MITIIFKCQKNIYYNLKFAKTFKLALINALQLIFRENKFFYMRDKVGHDVQCF